MSIRSDLLALNANIPTESVFITGAGHVRVRGLTAGERDKWEQYIHATRANGSTIQNFRASLVCRAIVDETGARVYSDSTADLEEVSSLPAKAVDKLFTVAQKLSGLGGEIEEMEKT